MVSKKAKQNATEKKHNYQLRAKLPLIMRGAAVLGLIVTVLFIGVGFYRGTSHTEFRLKPQDTQLSKDVVGVVNGYERRETDNGVLKYYLKADRATTFSDDHQELENVFLEIPDKPGGEKSDKVTSNKAIYIPVEGSKDFRIYFAGNVNVETRHDLKVKSEQIVYTKKTQIAESEVLVEFTRENLSGKSSGAIVNIGNKTLELLKDVDIDVKGVPGSKLAEANVKQAKIKAGHAFVEQVNEKIKLDGGVEIALAPDNKSGGRLTQPTDFKSNESTVYFDKQEIKKIEMEGNVYVYQKPTSANPKWMKTKANRAVATINKELEKLELYENVVIETTSNSPTPTLITSNTAIYEQAIGKINLSGGAEVKQGNDVVRGDVINADLFQDNKVKFAQASGHAFLKQSRPERTTEVSSIELNATFNQNQEIQSANSNGSSEVVITPSKVEEYTKIRMLAANAINLGFRTDGTLKDMNTQGRTTIKLNAPNNAPDSANKTLTADTVKTVLRSNGKELESAKAVGNAELLVEPLRNLPDNYKTTINAPRFNCDFYDENNARSCTAATGTKTVRIPTQPGKSRGKQTLIAKRLNTVFDIKTRDVERFDASGKARFSELDRKGISNNIIYTARDQVVRLRGSEPTVWDSQARVRAGEIDWNTKDSKSTYRRKVRTTYYSQKQTGGATPFGKTDSPVFITSNGANFDHKAKKAVFTGNARAWQGKNYVRGERLFLEQKEERFSGEGKVQSALYEADRTVDGKKVKTTVYASADKMFYQRAKGLLRYEKNVDIRQGAERIVGGIANIYLNKKNELSQTIVEKNVVITQPKRRATGDYAKYTASNESVVLRGNPAKVSDAESGSSSGRELTVNLKTKRVTAKGKATKNSPGRIRTVYKIKDGKLN